MARIIYDGNNDLSKVLLANGFAWHYKKYNQEDELAELEILARTQKKGLWAQDNPMPPWEYRKGGKTGNNNVNLKENEVLICNSSSAGSYHNHHCRGLSQCKAEVIKISILKAKADQRKACGYCY